MIDTTEKQNRSGRRALRVFGRILTVVLVNVLLLVFALYGVMFVLTKGPSPTARNLFVRSVRETSAVGWLANLYCSEEEIAAIESGGEDAEAEETDTSLVQVGGDSDDYGLVDEDGDGIILETVKGSGYVGYMMVVLDPTRMMLGTPSSFGGSGLTVEQMVKTYDCTAGVNGGGFYDPNGQGTGGIPEGMAIVDGKAYYAASGTAYNFVGFDSNYILHTGKMTAEEAAEKDIQFGCSFGPVLVSNGEAMDSDILASGVNPRTAIGQRADGAVLLLVVDGRQAYSLGATFADLAEIMLDYGAVNACNLDGGSSSMMWYGDGYVNHCASVIGIRPIPTGFLVK
ncbi:MAG: phosphodiester glycosidase family protein [Oscillospiraceae bacterium]|nr:phosphodiester glycosidase family protein [Oscillospiraceae bacterium]